MNSQIILSLFNDIPPVGRGKILDAGCGNLRYVRKLRKTSKIGDRIFPMDLFAPADGDADDTRFVRGSMVSLPYRSNSFAYAYSIGVLQLIDDVDKAVAEIHRVLKTGSHFYFCVRTRYSLFRVLRDLEIRTGVFRSPQYNVPYFHYFSQSDIERLMKGRFEITFRSGYYYNPIPRIRTFLFDWLQARIDRSPTSLRKSSLLRRLRSIKLTNEHPYVPPVLDGLPFREHPLVRALPTLINLSYHYIIIAKKI